MAWRTHANSSPGNMLDFHTGPEAAARLRRVLARVSQTSAGAGRHSTRRADRAFGTALPRRPGRVPEFAPHVRDRPREVVGAGRRLGRGPGAVGGIVV